jgi:hypothetical protein
VRRFFNELLKILRPFEKIPDLPAAERSPIPRMIGASRLELIESFMKLMIRPRP